MKRILSLIIFILMMNAVHAGDTIIVNKDARLDILTAKQAQINKHSAMMTSAGMYRGYRIQVISTNNRDAAFKIKSELLSKFPEQKTYVLFQSPYFKIRIGNFLKRDEADKFRKQLLILFPQGGYIVEDIIEYTPKPEEDLLSQ